MVETIIKPDYIIILLLPATLHFSYHPSCFPARKQLFTFDRMSSVVSRRSSVCCTIALRTMVRLVYEYTGM